jgi:hypothetical protein
MQDIESAGISQRAFTWAEGFCVPSMSAIHSSADVIAMPRHVRNLPVQDPANARSTSVSRPSGRR